MSAANFVREREMGLENGCWKCWEFCEMERNGVRKWGLGNGPGKRGWEMGNGIWVRENKLGWK